MPYLLDTNWIIDFLDREPGAVELIQRLLPEGISIVTYMELYEGTLRQANARHARSQLETFIAPVPIVPFSLAVARRCAELREDLRRRGRRVATRPRSHSGRDSRGVRPGPGH
jgi:predicted nucleic acid-binding protein